MNIKLFCTLFLVLSSTALANTKTSRCDNCLSDWSYSQRAKAIADENTSTVYILNIKNQIIKKYSIYSTPAEPGFSAQIFAYEESVELNVENAFKDHVIAVAKMDMLFTDLTVSDDIATSGYQLIGREYLVNDFLTRFAGQNVGIFDRIASTFVVPANSINLTNIDIVYRLNFKNGDKITIKVIGIKKIPLTGKIILEFIVVSVVDVDNNSVKFDSSGYTSGERRFEIGGQMALNEFMQAASRTGIPIYYSGNSFRPKVKIIDCPPDSPAKGKCIEPVPGTMLY